MRPKFLIRIRPAPESPPRIPLADDPGLGFACLFTISTPFYHSTPTEGNVRTCRQRVLQELLAIRHSREFPKNRKGLMTSKKGKRVGERLAELLMASGIDRVFGLPEAFGVNQ